MPRLPDGTVVRPERGQLVRMPQVGDFQVWHIPQVPGKAFFVKAEDYFHAEVIQNVLGDYDLFLEANRIRGDYSNASGIQVYTLGGWHDVGTIEEANFLVEVN